MTTYIDLASNGISLGQSVSGVQNPWAVITTPAANSLNLQGATSTTPCELSGVDQPAADTDAANRLYVQQYVKTQIRGLQVKSSAQLCSKTPVSLAGTSSIRRWPGPFTGTGQLANFMTLPDYTSTVLDPSITAASFSASGPMLPLSTTPPCCGWTMATVQAPSVTICSTMVATGLRLQLVAVWGMVCSPAF